MNQEESTFRGIVKAAIDKAIGSDPSLPRDPAAVVTETTRLLLPEVRQSSYYLWVVLNAYVKNVYDQIIHSGRKAARAIEREQDEADGQIALPGWSDLLAWRHTMDDGTEIAIAYATLAQVEMFIGRYAKLARENDVKRRYLVALSEQMRAAGFKPSQSVADFYANRQAA